ncbi:hypothetical protein D1872_247760 [compost metagenome]
MNRGHNVLYIRRRESFAQFLPDGFPVRIRHDGSLMGIEVGKTGIVQLELAHHRLQIFQLQIHPHDPDDLAVFFYRHGDGRHHDLLPFNGKAVGVQDDFLAAVSG